jgi:hypothetical protein
LELVQDSKPSIREAAVDALGKAITGTLANLHGGVDTINADGTITGETSVSVDTAAVQIDLLENMVLVALESLYNDRERDVQVGVLKVLSQVLQRNGEHLTDGWTPVFRLLASAAETSSPETVALGCESLQIVYSDFLDKMDDRNIQKCLAVSEIYGKQEMDVNVSLSIISMLWNLGDMLGSRDAVAAVAAAVPKTTSADVSTETLLEAVYDALFKISKDARPEVRNSGARSLFAMVAAHGNRLSAGLWEACLWGKLFPLLRYSFHMSVTSSKEEAESALLGRSKGEQVRLVVHHSRNTEQKQWDETVVVCLAGMSRLMHSQFERMARMDGFDDGWSELMLVVESSLAGGRKEVALAAMSFLGGVLAGGGADGGGNDRDDKTTTMKTTKTTKTTNNSEASAFAALSEPMWQRWVLLGPAEPCAPPSTLHALTLSLTPCRHSSFARQGVPRHRRRRGRRDERRMPRAARRAHGAGRPRRHGLRVQPGPL